MLRPHRLPLDLRVAPAPLAAKLDALGSALAAVREAHRDVMPPIAWGLLHEAQAKIAEAMLHCDAPSFPAVRNETAGLLPPAEAPSREAGGERMRAVGKTFSSQPAAQENPVSQEPKP